MATGMFENETSGNCLQQQPPGVPDSPDSIPLPDSPPPETEERVVGDVAQNLEAEAPEVADTDGRNNNNSEGVLNNMPLYSSTSSSMNNLSRSKKSGRKPQLAEEYDPSEPLTSSDEEEHSLLLIEGGRSSNRSNNTHKETNSSSNNILDMGGPTSPPVRPYRLSTTPPPLTSSKTSVLAPSVNNKVGELKSASTAVANSNSSNSNSNSSNTISNINTGNSASSNNNTNRLDLSNIPVPPEENRRPVIHFSIPTRHRLLPMSSLMKRQKGGGRKDGKGADGTAGSQYDGFKGSEKSQDGDEDDEDEDIDESNRPKISLVAEIFGGTDDEDENNEDETESAQQQPPVQSEDKTLNDALDSDSIVAIPNNGLSGNDTQQQPVQAIDANSGRWKLVADEATEKPGENESVVSTSLEKESGSICQQPSTILQTGDTTADPVGEDEPEIIEIVTLNVPPPNRLRPLRRRPFLGRFGLENGGEPEVIDIDKDDDEQPPANFSAPTAPTTPPTTEDIHQHRSSVSPPRRSSSGILDISTNSEGTDREKRLSRSSPGDSSPVRPERHFKRPHSSSSVSNCEEGEIIDQVNPNKKRRKDKKKKTKRRKRSKDSMTPPPSTSSKLPEKRLSDSVPPPASTSDHEENETRGGGGAISWRKPSKRTQNRNYRDGKPKADDTFFREKEVEEKQKSSSPVHRRSRNSGRKERSPVKEKSTSGRHRRDGSPKNNRSHSKSPAAAAAGRTSRSRSRSSGRPYRSRRRNRHSRSKSSNSVSDKSRSARSSSRRRSRRRYRRSTSRHHAGDSRSPSYITEPIRSRSSHYSKLRGRSRTRSRDRHVRGRHRNKRSVTRSRTPSPRGHKKNRKPESIDRQQRKRQIKEKEKQQQQEEVLSDSKEKRREKERLKEKEKRKKKEKEKPKEEEKSKQVKEKPKEKEKKKKKKRREKSPTPVKAIVADGDSIVVSLSFQKGKTASATSNAQPSSASNEERKENGLDTSENSEPVNKPKPSTPAKNASSDAAESISEFNEEQERTHSSPAKLSSVTDEDGSTTPTDPNATERTAKCTKSDDKGTEAAKVTSTGGGSCGSPSPFETERSFSAAPDSTKTATPQPSEQQDSSFNHSLRSSPTTDGESNAQGDSLVTSTGDSMDPAGHGTEDEAKSNTSPSKSQTDSTKHFSGLPHKIAAGSASPRSTQTSSASSDNNCATTATAASTSNASTSGSTNSTLTNSSQSSVTPVMTRPLIGNIPGLYPSTAIITGGAIPVPPPIVIPTPPPPRILYTNPGGPSTTPMLNANVLASVASALLAVRQTQPNFSGKMQATGSNSSESSTNNTQLRHMNVLGPKTQNFSLQSNFRGGLGNSSFSQGQDACGGGESPMSPNSSDGDDLFEPPTDHPQSEGGKVGKNGQLFGGMPVMVGGTANANDSFSSASGGNKPKERNNLFDTLFGVNDSKKSVVNKPEKMSKAKAKHRKGAPKKETIKVNTSGGLTEGELRLTDEVPTSAVELIVKQKYLKKLNRQERVIEEVKVALKPYYSKRQVNKDEYKEILRRAVPKICHNKTGEINPGKIKELVEAYVKRIKHVKRRGI